MESPIEWVTTSLISFSSCCSLSSCALYSAIVVCTPMISNDDVCVHERKEGEKKVRRDMDVVPGCQYTLV